MSVLIFSSKAYSLADRHTICQQEIFYIVTQKSRTYMFYVCIKDQATTDQFYMQGNNIIH